MSVIRCLSLILGAMSATSCGETSSGSRLVILDFVAESDPGHPLEGVLIALDGTPLGTTDSRGSLRVSIGTKLGERIQLEHDCPPGHRDPTQPKMLSLGNYRGIDDVSPPIMQLAIRCPPTNRLAVIVVRADHREGLAVVLNGRTVAKTNAAGVAHFSTSVPPGTELRVRLDTSEYRHLVPRNPMRVFTVPDAPEAFVIDQAFQTVKRGRRQQRQRPRIVKIE